MSAIERSDKGLRRSSIIAFSFVSVLLFLYALLVSYGFEFQDFILRVSKLSYEQRVLLERTGRRIHFLIENSENKLVSDRVYEKIRVDILDDVEIVRTHHNQLKELLYAHRGKEKYFFLLKESQPLFDEIDLMVSAFQRYSLQLEKTSLRELRYRFGLWGAPDELLFQNETLIARMYNLNSKINEESLQKTRMLYIFYEVILFLVLLGLWLIWFFTLKPFSEKLKASNKEIIKKNKSLAFQASHDNLTKLPSRSHFYKDMNALFDRGKGVDKVALLLIDVDNFKSINDNFGHQQGDRALIIIAKCFLYFAKNKEKAYRIAGDEFALVFYDVLDRRNLKQRIDDLMRILHESCILDGNRITCSIGVAWGNECGASVKEVFSAADTALYEVKENGRNHYRLFDEISNLSIKQVLNFEYELHSAVKNKEFVVFYQSINNIENGSVIGFEALARWDHPEKGLLRPDVWLSIAERLSLLSDISKIIIDRVNEDYKFWLKKGFDAKLININITESMLVTGFLIDYIEELVGKNENGHSWLNIEVTESIVFDRSMETICSQLDLMRQQGVLISLDDFGTGFASLAHLKRVPFDFLKIDSSFVSKIESEEDTYMIVSIIITLAHALKKKVICEGVETLAVHNMLLDMECDYAQGYFYSYPLPAHEVLMKKEKVQPL